MYIAWYFSLRRRLGFNFMWLKFTSPSSWLWSGQQRWHQSALLHNSSFVHSHFCWLTQESKCIDSMTVQIVSTWGWGIISLLPLSLSLSLTSSLAPSVPFSHSVMECVCSNVMEPLLEGREKTETLNLDADHFSASLRSLAISRSTVGRNRKTLYNYCKR